MTEVLISFGVSIGVLIYYDFEETIYNDFLLLEIG